MDSFNTESPPNEASIIAWWNEFNARIQTNEDAYRELFERAKPLGLMSCRHCYSADTKLEDGNGMYRCNACAQKSSITAGSLFHRAKEIRAWLAILSAFESGLSISSCRLATLTGIAQSSGMNIQRRYRMVINNLLADGATEIPSALLCGLFGRRSKETPAKAHPVSEQEAIDDADNSGSANVNHKQSRQKLAKLSITFNNMDDNAKLVFNCLTEGPLNIDQICQRTNMSVQQVAVACLSLELAELAIRLPGDKYKQNNLSGEPESVEDHRNSNLTAQVISSVDVTQSRVRLIHQRVSRKYMQQYLAEKAYLHPDIRDSFPSLLEVCFRSKPISYTEMLNYVSPSVLKIPLPKHFKGSTNGIRVI